MKWINFGGGHHITREDYDIERLIRLVKHIREKYEVEVYIEPGEAVALNAGFLVTTVMEKVSNGKEIAILDASAACHMPDVLEMPYRPNIIGAGKPGEKPYTYTPVSYTHRAIAEGSYGKLTMVAAFLTACKLMVKCKVVKLISCNNIAVAAVPALLCNKSRTKSSHKTRNIGTDYIFSGEQLKASQYSIVVKGSALNNYIFAHKRRITKLYDLIKRVSYNRI